MHTYLVVDDDAIVRRVLRTVLEKDGRRIIEASNGVEALSLLRDVEVDLILSDLMMPEMDGYTLGYECRRNSQWRDIPIVFMTGVYDDAEGKELASQLGAASYIAKPVDLDLLPTILAEALANKHVSSDHGESRPGIPDDGVYFRHYNQVLIHLLEQKMDELEHSNQALRASEARYRRLAEHAQDVIYRLRIRPALTLEFISLAIANITGYSPQEFYDDPDLLYRLVHVDDFSFVDAATAGRSAFGRPFPVRFKHRSGAIVWTEHRMIPIYEDGELAAVEGIARDVTEYKAREEELRRTILRLTIATHAAGLGVWEYDLQTGARYMDDRMSLLFGLEPGALGTDEKAWAQLVHTDDAAELEAAIAAIRRGEPPKNVCVRFVLPNGQIHHVELQGDVERDAKGAPRRILGVVRDVTLELESQRQLRLLSTALEAAANGVAITDREGHLEWVNSAFAALTGYTSEECIGKNPRDLIRSGRHDQVFYRDLWDTILAGRVWRGEMINRRKDGVLYTEEQTITPVTDAQGTITHFIAIKQDITARGQVEAALRESESRYRSLFESNHSVMLLIDPVSGSVIDANPAAARYYGWSRSALRQMKISNINTLPPAEIQAEMNLARQERRNHFFFRHLRADGSVRDVEVYSGPIQYEGQSLLYSIVHDISERKEAEAALRRSEANYAHAQRLTRLGSWSYDFGTDSSLWSNEMYRLFDLDPALPSPSITEFLETLHPEDRERVATATSQIAATGESAEIEYRSNPNRGASRYFSANVEPAVDDAGNVSGVYGTVLDITTHRQHERELEAVASVSAALRTAVTRNEMVPAILTEMLALFSAGGAAFDHLDQNTGTTTIELGVGVFASCTGISLPIGAGISRDILETGAPFFTNDIAHEPRALFPELLGEMHSLAGVPLAIDNRITGVLWLTSQYELTGHDIGILVAIADIAASAIRRAALYEHTQVQAEEMAQIMRSVPAGVLLLDAEARIRTANARAEHYLQLSAGAKIGDRLTHLGDKKLSDILNFRTPGRQCTYQSASHTYEVISQEVDAGPTPSGWVVVIRDITDELAATEQFQRQERLAAIGQLAAGIAHDFNNIMSVITVYAQLTSESPALTERERERVLAIDTQAQRATEMIRQILDFSRRAVFERATVDLLPLAKEQIKLLMRTLPENIRIQFKHEDAPYFVNADPTRIAQVIMNLSINARDAMPEGGSLVIELARENHAPIGEGGSARREPGAWVRLSVADTGSGIPDEVITHIFEPFFTTKAPGHGTGLGLAQVHGIIGQHGGHITVSSKVGAGSVFSIYLPALVVLTPGQQITTTPGRAPRGHGETILVVEDDDQLRPTLADLLTLWNYRVLQASNGAEALNQLASGQEKIDLVLSDVVMPVIGGIGMLKQMRDSGITTPVVMLTGHAMSDTMDALGAYGLSGWLAKPPDVIQLAEIITASLPH